MPLGGFKVWMAGAALVSSTVSSGLAAELSAELADPKWDGQTVPADEVCRRFDGEGKTPPLRVSGIPAGSEALILAFNDESYTPMDNGGHGIVRVAIDSGSTSAEVEAIPGETDDLPAGVSKVKGHLASGWSGTGGAYLPPCSGGRGNTYSVTLKAVKGEATLAETKVPLGVF